MNRLRIWGWGLLLSLVAAGAQAQGASEFRSATPAEEAGDRAAFGAVDGALAQLSDVQSAVVVLRGRVVYEFYRDGNPATLRNVYSVQKSALSTLVGIAIGQGLIASLDQPVLALVPAWAGLNPDPRAAAITVRHLLTMSAGFEVNDPSGTAAPLPPPAAWARPLRHAPGAAFAYDNSLVSLLTAVLEQATGMPPADYARAQLVRPLGMAEPSYERGLRLRTLDMARLGQLALQKGAWAGRQLVPESYMLAATGLQNGGGPPVSLPYGFMWWQLQSDAARRPFMAAGFGGQYVWVAPRLEMVIAITSTGSGESMRRGQALQLIRAQIYPAAQRRLASGNP